MASDSNNGLHQESMNPLFHHPRMVSFQLGAMNSSTGMISSDLCSLNENGSMASMFMSADSSMINHMDATTLARYPAGSVVGEPMPRFVHVSGSPAYWSPEEVELLNIGLIKYANEPSIQKFTKIAALLPRKTIRDVALRCQWMINKENGKRRKVEENYAAKKVKDMKEKMMGAPSTATIHRSPISLTMNHMNIHDQLPSEVRALDAEILRLLDENDGCLREIARNLNGSMIQENINLFHYTKNNIMMIENRINMKAAAMKQLPGRMRQLPPLPVSVNDELLSGLIPLIGNIHQM
ncbi:unnamed protein product [Musa acuminata subsp. malaccensis]|uniref:(wild Malaysian banana) hypothetical protein n=1 Tax=Musa acuminata subsp. malaccensis TaxID=214687 RepID=A0A8D7B0C8_MUSAM|nr:unnamed protein product [Musa acuminata subsp. malaccensis]